MKQAFKGLRTGGRGWVLGMMSLGMSIGAVASQAEPVQQLEIVDRAIAFHGGGAYESSEAEMEMCSKSGCFRVKARMDGGEYSFQVEGQARGTQRRVRIDNNETELWVDGVATPITAGQEQGYRDWVMARIYFCFLPYRLNDPGVWKEDLGIEKWAERSLHRVRVTFEAGSSTDADDVYTYWFDSETGRLEQLAYSYVGRPGGIRFRRLNNYRRVGGVLFFDQDNLGAEGEGLSPDGLNPRTVGDLREISQVQLKNIAVKGLKPGD